MPGPRSTRNSVHSAIAAAGSPTAPTSATSLPVSGMVCSIDAGGNSGV